MARLANEQLASRLVHGDCQPEGYLTTEYLAALWDERCRQADQYREERPDDLKGIDLRQRQAMTVLQAYRLLSVLEQQLGLQLALPVLGQDKNPRAPIDPSTE